MRMIKSLIESLILKRMLLKSKTHEAISVEIMLQESLRDSCYVSYIT